MKFAEVLGQNQEQAQQLVQLVVVVDRLEELQEHLLVILHKLRNVQLAMLLVKSLQIHVQVAVVMVLNKLEKNYVLIFLQELIQELN